MASEGSENAASLPATALVHAGAEGHTRVRIRRGWLVRRALLAADVTGLVAAFLATEALFRGTHELGSVDPPTEILVFVLSLPIWIVAAKLYGLYDRDEERATHSTADEVFTVFHLVTVVVWVFYATSWLLGLTHPDQAKLAFFWAVALALVIAMRLVARSLARRHPAYVQNTLIVGAGEVGQLIARKILQHPEYRINLVAFADAHPRTLRADVGRVEILESIDDVVDAVRAKDVDRVVVAFSEARDELNLALVRALREHDVQIDVVPRLFDAVAPSSVVHAIEGLPLLSVASVRISRSSRFLKRIVDLAVSAALLLVLAPAMMLLALLIRRDSRGPALFRQTRVGLDMREFTLLKFRTMHVTTDEAPHREYLKEIMSKSAAPLENSLYKLDRSQATTKLGAWLRKTSLDELPQLLNVFRGEMSLVGPRPAIPYELELYEPYHLERFAVPAGLTGLWQVEARARSTFREALDMDVAYARGWSLGLDLRLLLRTPLALIRTRETA
jgi:exopolysaccharide biosynthesis polyprenyl glycosylphosphotransferase